MTGPDDDRGGRGAAQGQGLQHGAHAHQVALHEERRDHRAPPLVQAVADRRRRTDEGHVVGQRGRHGGRRLVAVRWHAGSSPRGSTVSTVSVVLSFGSPGIAKRASCAARDQFAHFELAVLEAAARVTFQISGGTGDADLYVRRGSQPTTTEFDCRPFLDGNDEICTVDDPVADTYFIGVRGRDLLGRDPGRRHQVTAGPCSPADARVLMDGPP